MDHFLGWGRVKTVLGSTLVVEQLLFSILVPSIQTFDFDLIFGSSFTFWRPIWSFLGSG